VSRNTTSALAARAVGSQFDLVLIASNRVREMRHARKLDERTAHVPDQVTDISTALLEIEQGHIGREYLTKELDLDTMPKRSR